MEWMFRISAGRVCACLGLLLVLPLAAHAQTGKITGRVTDASTGEALPGVNILVEGTTNGTASDIDGYFSIIGVRPGTYSVRATYIGFASRTVENVRVLIDKTTELDIEMSEETFVGEEVIITAERPLVQRDLTSSSQSVSSEELRALPVQSFSDVVNLQAGVVEGHFRGGRVGEVAYLVDGIPVNDVYDQSFAFQVENDAIQEVEIISGTFNAEYGQAQSGVVNIVTKDGGEDYRATLNAYGGDYLTTDRTVFGEAASFSPAGNYEVQGSLSGPVPGLGSRLTFFASGRYVDSGGFLYGRRVVQPVYAEVNERQPVQVGDRTVFVPALGDSAAVSMNNGQQKTGQLKLTARLGKNRLSVSGLVQRDQGRNFDPLFRYNPDGIPTVYGNSVSGFATYNQIIGSSSFLDLKLAYFENEVSEYVYENPLDPRYPRDAALRELRPSFSFYLGGARMSHFTRKTRTLVTRADFTSQLTRTHLVKAGVEWKTHTLDLDNFEVKNNASTGFAPAIPPAGTPDHVLYQQMPVEGSAYLQDKIELEYLVMNIGARIDYFDARTSVPTDFGRPKTGERRDTEPKFQISPRIGLGYPLSSRGVLHVAYGHFFQMPPFDFLYTNPDYIYDPEQGLNRAFGYADLEPQQTIAYEIGLQQALTDALGLTLTAYYKDIRNLLGTRLETISAGVGEDFQLSRYGRFVNRDYGQVKGVIFAIEKRPGDGYSVNVDYTFQIARGNASNPRDRLIAEQGGNEPEKQLVPLDWDRRHQLNTTLTVGDANKRFGLVSIIGRLGSGLPYTPSVADERTGLENSARRPGVATFDVFATRTVSVGGLEPGLFLRIYNLFDRRNVTGVYTDTGRPTPNLRFYSGQALGLNSKDEFLLRPDFYSAPRLVQVGFSLSL